MSDTGLVEATTDVLPTTTHPLQTTYEPRHVTYGPGAGLSVGLVGIGCLAISLFGLKWLGVRDGTFLTLSSHARHEGPHAVGAVAYNYLAWAAFVLVVLTAAFVVLACIPVPRTAAGNTYPRVFGAIIAGTGAALQAYAIVHSFPPALVAPGAWLGVAGYFVVIAGLVIGARRRVR
jgi:hypothetical protein